MTSSNQLFFNGPANNQQWSFPDSIIYYITKNPTSAIAYQKIVQTCKYFFAKNPILVIERFLFGYQNRKWSAYLGDNSKVLDMTNISCKLWITDKFEYYTLNSPSSAVTSLFPKFYRFDAKHLKLSQLILPFNDFKFLSSNVRNFILYETVVKNANGEIIPLEDVLKGCAKVEQMLLYCHVPTLITSNTIKELFTFPDFQKIKEICLYNVPENFDFYTLSFYMKKNKNFKFCLYFPVEAASETPKNRVEEIIDEILSTESHDYKPPYIYCPGISDEKSTKLRNLCLKC